MVWAHKTGTGVVPTVSVTPMPVSVVFPVFVTRNPNWIVVPELLNDATFDDWSTVITLLVAGAGGSAAAAGRDAAVNASGVASRATRNTISRRAAMLCTVRSSVATHRASGSRGFAKVTETHDTRPVNSELLPVSVRSSPAGR